MKIKIASVCVVMVLAFLVSGCKTVPEKSMRTTVVLIGGKDAPDGFLLSGPFGVKSRLAGTVASAADGRKTMMLESFDWFDNWHDGWTEADFAASGTLILEKEGSGWTLTQADVPVLEYAERATIRYRDTIIEGDDALKRLSWRYDRIAAASGFLGNVLGDAYPDPAGFRNEAGKFLFPEAYGYAPGKKPGIDANADRVKAEGIAWDTSYTAAVFPPEFADVRNTGTLYRDWEESADLFYVLYVWDHIFGNRLQDVRVIEKKQKKATKGEFYHE